MINWEISLGSLATIATVLLAGTGFYWKQTFYSKKFTEDIVEIKADLKILNKVVMDLALQNQRMIMIEKAIDELRHGHGYIYKDKDQFTLHEEKT